MKTTLFLMVAAVAVGFTTLSDITWSTNSTEAMAQAKKQNKLVLLSFSGSDWCNNCLRLDETLFQSPEFAEYASEKLVLLKADFPMRKKNKLSEEQTKHNEALAAKYNKDGTFPNVVLLDASGAVVGHLTTPKGSAKEYLKELQQICDR